MLLIRKVLIEMNKIFSYFKKNKEVCIVLILLISIKICALISLGINYNIKSDDLSYIKSGITFLETGKITMHGVISAQIMPGMTFLIAIFAFIFGKGLLLWLSLKVLWIVIGMLSFYYLYKIINLYLSKKYAVIPCLFFFMPDFIWMDNLILTETPFMLLFILLIYNFLKLEITHDNKYYKYVIIIFILAIIFRPTIGLVPVFFFLYLLMKKYNFKLLIKQYFFASLILVLIFLPWSIRNYLLFDDFIPLTYGIGNPLLLGTYQGYGFPKDEELDYELYVEKEFFKLKNKYELKNEKKLYLKKYLSLEHDKIKAKYRMQEWWKRDSYSMLKSYLYIKPKVMLNSSFYWKPIFNISKEVNLNIRKIELYIFYISLLIILINKKFLKETFLFLCLYGYSIALYSYTFAFSRYAQTLYFLRYIIIGLGIKVLFDLLKYKERDTKNEKVYKIV